MSLAIVDVEVTAGNADDAREGLSHGWNVCNISHRSTVVFVKQRMRLRDGKVKREK